MDRRAGDRAGELVAAEVGLLVLGVLRQARPRSARPRSGRPGRPGTALHRLQAGQARTLARGAVDLVGDPDHGGPGGRRSGRAGGREQQPQGEQHRAGHGGRGRRPHRGPPPATRGPDRRRSRDDGQQRGEREQAAHEQPGRGPGRGLPGRLLLGRGRDVARPVERRQRRRLGDVGGRGAPVVRDRGDGQVRAPSRRGRTRPWRPLRQLEDQEVGAGERGGRGGLGVAPVQVADTAGALPVGVGDDRRRPPAVLAPSSPSSGSGPPAGSRAAAARRAARSRRRRRSRGCPPGVHPPRSWPRPGRAGRRSGGRRRRRRGPGGPWSGRCRRPAARRRRTSRPPPPLAAGRRPGRGSSGCSRWPRGPGRRDRSAARSTRRAGRSRRSGPLVGDLVALDHDDDRLGVAAVGRAVAAREHGQVRQPVEVADLPLVAVRVSSPSAMPVAARVP